jgi:hypothetical protein
MLAGSFSYGQHAYRAFPHFVVTQFEGSSGALSLGFGYNVFKGKARASIQYGVVPKDNVSISVLSAKFFVRPVTLTIWNRIRMNPVDFGVISSFNYGSSFKNKQDAPDPAISYWWQPAFRNHFGMESSMTYQFPKDHTLRSITGYIEFNTNELYFVSFIRNLDEVRFQDVVKIGTGARISF